MSNINTNLTPEATKCFNAIKVNDPRFKNWDEIDVWYEYATHPDAKVKQIACEELLARHNGDLATIAKRIHATYPQVMDFSDFLGTARQGAMIAYRRFNPDKQTEKGKKASVFTYTHATVEKYLLSEIDNSVFVKCPSQRRAVRSYLKGRYDDKPEKKLAIEQEYGLDTEEKIEDLKEKFKFLNPTALSLDEKISTGDSEDFGEDFGTLLADDSCDTDENIVCRVDRENLVANFTAAQQMVYKMYFVNQNSVKGIAAKTGMKENKVRADIKEIRSQFAKKYPEMAEGRTRQRRKTKVTIEVTEETND